MDPIPGRDLRLSIDVELEQAIERAMRPHAAGAAVVVDVRTGRLLALYSKPDFDPNDLSGGAGQGARARGVQPPLRRPAAPDARQDDERRVPARLDDEAVQRAGRRSRTTSSIPEHTEKCEGYVVFGRRIFRCSHVHGKVHLHEAIARSCNVYFFHLAETVGMDRIARVAQAFGLGEKTGLGINPEAPGRIPTRSWYALRYRGQFRVGFTLNMAIGEGDVTVTPLQLALAYAALANGGTLYQPQVVRAVETSDGAVVQEFPPRIRRQIAVAPENLRRVTDALYDVVNDPTGTAYPGARSDARRRRQDGHGADGLRREEGGRRRRWPGTSRRTTPGSRASRRRTTPRSPSRCWSSTAAPGPRSRCPSRCRSSTSTSGCRPSASGHPPSAKSPPRGKAPGARP